MGHGARDRGLAYLIRTDRPKHWVPAFAGMSGMVESVRIDIWLWRARFAKTRSLAATLVERGAVRLMHQGRQTRLDKPSRVVHPGDEITFAVNGRVTAVRVEALGERRGPPAEARALYIDLASSTEVPRGEG